MNDLYRDESIDRISQLGGTQVPEPGLFTGFTEWVPKLAARGGMATLRGMDLLGSIPAITKDYFKGGTEEQDKYFAMHDFRYNQVIDELTPGPKDVGIAGQVVGGLVGTLPQLLINWPTGLASMHLSAAEDLVREGVPAGRANTVGAIDALLMGLGMKLPMGNTLLQRIGTGAGTNVALGTAQRGASGMILQGTPAEGQYKAFDLAPTMIDLVMGMHFGAFAHLFNDPAAKSVSQEFKAMYDWAQSLKPSEVAALATIRQAQHSNVDSTPGKPIDPTDVEAHVNRLKAAVGMLAKDEPVNVENMPAGKFAPDPIKETENAQTATEMVRTAEAVRAEEGIREPTVPDYLRTTEAQRATYESLQQLPREEQAAGVGQIIEAQLRRANVPEHEAIANGAIWEAFAKTMGETHGISPADVLTKYRLSVSRGTDRITGALEQGAMPHPDIGPGKLMDVNGYQRQTTDSTGKPIASTPEGVKAFYEWFKNSAVVDREGRPQVVYHGTNRDFEAHHPAAERSFLMWADAQGFYFTRHPKDASNYAGNVTGSNVRPVYLRVEEPALIEPATGEHPAYISPERRRQLENQGRDGVIYNDGEEIVVFNPTQIKSAIGNRGTFDANDPNILHQKVAEPFYSELARQVDNVDMKSAPVKGWKDWIKGQVSKGGVKAEEIKWSGLEEWLDLQEGKVTKEQVQEFLRNNGVKVEEVMLGGTPIDHDLRDAALQFTDGVPTTPEAWTNLAGVLGDAGRQAMGSGDGARAERLFTLADQADRHAEAINPLTGSTAGSTKFSQYQLPGGENYRELLLTLPEKSNPTELPEGFRIEHNRNTQGVQWEIYGPGTGRYASGATQEAAIARFYRLHAGENGVGGVGEKQTFQSSHFDQPNILAHVRFNERTDADGKKVLFIEEFQSDWAQQGRKKGFAGGNSDAEFAALQTELARVREIETNPPNDAAYEAAVREEGRIVDRMNAIHDAKRYGLPSAPFVGKTDAWVALTLKRMIRYAAENGYDKVAWTKGEQQVDRYSQALRKAVDVIEWKKTPEGVQIVGYKGELRGRLSSNEEVRLALLEHRDALSQAPHGRPMSGHERDELSRLRGKVERNKVVDTTEKETDLSDSIGKSMADRIRNDPAQSGTIEGENINVSDTGMAGFYNKIVPSVANSLLKKLGGGKVGEVALPVGKESAQWKQGMNQMVRGEEKQPSFEITPEMRDKAMAGQPLFQPSRGQIHFGNDQTIINLFENANASTFLHETGHFFLQVTRDLAMAPNAPIKAMEHWAAIAKELKIEGGEIPREAHETFARSFEAYLREGKAPTPELKSVFKQFRDWLVQIYQSIKDLNVELSDEMRAIMDRMLTSQSRETGETRSVPSETPGSGLPPPSIGGESPAASGFTPMTIESPEMRSILEGMAANESGWAEPGGRMIRDEQGQVTGRTEWIPNSDWWAGRPSKFNPEQTREAVRKAIAGEKLGKAEQRMVDYLVEVANDRMKERSQSTGIPPEDLPDMAQHLIDVGATADDMTLQEADLVAKAAEVDEAAVEAAAIQYENDKTGFLIEMRRITDEKEAAQTQAPSETQGQKGGNETDRLLAQEADRYVMDNPDQLVPVGVNQDGSSIQMKASEYLAQARNEAALAREDIHLLEVAAGCLMGT